MRDMWASEKICYMHVLVSLTRVYVVHLAAAAGLRADVAFGAPHCRNALTGLVLPECIPLWATSTLVVRASDDTILHHTDEW